MMFAGAAVMFLWVPAHLELWLLLWLYLKAIL